jgi:voltage-gated potassium channel Kch
VSARSRARTLAAAGRVAGLVTLVAGVVVTAGGTGAWLAERGAAGATVRTWGDGLWWALTTLTTVGYGDHVPVTVAGRAVGAAVMVAGIAVIGGVAAGVALLVAHAVATTEEQALEAEAESVERRLERRLDGLDRRLARIEEHLRTLGDDRHGR